MLAASLQACSGSPSGPDTVEVVNEPVDAEPDPPMMPVVAALVPHAEPSLPTRAVPAAEIQESGDGTPTAEQRQLTVRKQARIARNQAAALPPQHHPMALGMMVGPSAY